MSPLDILENGMEDEELDIYNQVCFMRCVLLTWRKIVTAVVPGHCIKVTSWKLTLAMLATVPVVSWLWL